MDLLTHRNTGRMSGLLPVSEDVLRLDSKHEAGVGGMRGPNSPGPFWIHGTSDHTGSNSPVNLKIIFTFAMSLPIPPPRKFYTITHVTL